MRIHQELQRTSLDENALFNLTEADVMATRWLLFDSLTYYVRHDVEQYLKISPHDARNPKAVYEAIRNLTDAQFAFLVRMALAGNAASKLPTSMAGYFMRQVAEGAGVNLTAIEETQEKRAQTRRTNAEAKIALYETRIKRHESKRAA